MRTPSRAVRCRARGTLTRNPLSDDVLPHSRRLFWPIVIVPHQERSHTIQVIGWRGNRPRALRNVKLSFAGTVRITESGMTVRHLYLGRWLFISLRGKDIESVRLAEEGEGLVEVRFRRARMGGLVKFLARGAPEGRLLLNLPAAGGRLLEEARELLGRMAGGS